MDKYLITKEDAQKKECDLLFKELGASKEGLSAAEAAARLSACGPNSIKEVSTSLILTVLHYFWGPIPWMIEIAGILSLIVRQYADFYIILILLIVNGMVDFWEEFQAGNAIKALKKKLAPKCMVKRNGSWLEMDAMQLVPGDIIKLRLGDIIPADAKLFEGDYLTVDQIHANGRVASRYEKNQRPGFFRIHYKTRRNDRSCDCNGRKYIFWEDNPIGGKSKTGLPFPKSGASNWRLSHLYELGPRLRSHDCTAIKGHPLFRTCPIRPDPDHCLHSRSYACCALCHNGTRSPETL